MLANIVRAKVSTHGLMVAIGVLAFFAHSFFSDPHMEAWMRVHWAVKDAMDAAGATLAVYGLYRDPTKTV